LGDVSRFEPTKSGWTKTTPNVRKTFAGLQRGPAGFVVEAFLLCGVLVPQLYA
jgi:hypothetical protein